MANEVTYKVRAQILTSGEERLQNVKKNLEDIQKTDKASQPENISKGNQPQNIPKQDSHSKAVDLYLKEVDSLTKGFSILAKSIESPVMLLGMLKEGLFNAARSTAKKADNLQMKEAPKQREKADNLQNEQAPRQREEPKPEAERLKIPNDLKKELQKTNAKRENEQKEAGNRLSVPEKQESVTATPTADTMDDKDNLQNNMLGDAIGGFAKSLGIAGGALMGVTAVAIGVDKALKKMNEATLAAGERMAMLQTTGNAAGADLSEWDNSLWGSFVNSIPILGAWIRGNKIEKVADWTAYQPFAKLIPGLLDYKYKTGSEGSGADVAKKVTEDTGLDTGYDFATRFGILNKMSEYTGKDDDAGVTRELLSSSRVLGLDPDMLVDLIGNSLRYSKEGNGSIMTSIEKTAMDTGLDRSRYKELIRGFDEIIKKQISIGVPVKVENVSEMAGILGQAGDTWKGEQGLQIQMSMSDRLRQAGNLTSDEDVALMQWTMKENESYHDWRMRMDKGLDEQSFTTMSKRFIDETGNDEVTGNLRLMNTFGLSTYTQADELRKLMIKMNGRDSETGEKLNDTTREEARVEFQKKMNEIKDSERSEELEFLERVNTTMETTQQEVTSRLDNILNVLQEHLSDKEAENEYPVKLQENNFNPLYSAESSSVVLDEQAIQSALLKHGADSSYVWKDNLRREFDTNRDKELDYGELKLYHESLNKLIEKLDSLSTLPEIKKLLENGIEER